MKSKLPSTEIQLGGQKRDLREVWIRLEAFLSTRAPTTQVTYAGVMAQWCKFLGAKAGTPGGAQALLLATDVHASAFRKWLLEQPGQAPRGLRSFAISKTKELSTERRRAKKKSGLESTQTNSTVWKKFAALRRMYRVLVSASLVGFNPFDTDRVPPPPKEAGKKRPTEMIPYEAVMKIVSTPDPKSPKGQRDRAILAAFFGGGLRRSEVAALRIGDFRKTRSGTPYLYLRSTKAQKDAEQAIPQWTAKEIEKVVAHRRTQGASDADYLFVTFSGPAGLTEGAEPVSHSGLYKLFKLYCELAQVKIPVSPHSARATAITRLLDDGLTHREVQEFSRHASIQMVEMYDKKRKDVDKSPAKKLDY